MEKPKPKPNIIEQAGIKTERLPATAADEERIMVTCSPLYFPLTTSQAITLMNMLAWHLADFAEGALAPLIDAFTTGGHQIERQ